MPQKRKTRSANEDSAPAESGTAGAETETGSKLPVPSPSVLTLEDVHSAISRYSEHVSKLSASKPDSKLQELDEWRLKVLPDLVRSRDPAWIDKDELKKLMDWKLYVCSSLISSTINQKLELGESSVRPCQVLLLKTPQKRSNLAPRTRLHPSPNSPHRLRISRRSVGC